MTMKAPWTDDQVKSLNDYQTDRRFHPFTCGAGNRTNPAHRGVKAMFGHHDYGLLVATSGGWICLACSYQQDWAYS